MLVTGDRDWVDAQPVDVVIGGLLSACRARGEILEVLNGKAKGADTLADTWRMVDGIDMRAFAADWKAHGRAAGPIRNRVMLDEQPDLVVAFHDGLEDSKGTKDCVNEAVRRGIPVWHVQHLGVQI